MFSIDKRKSALVSVVIPVYNEAEVIPVTLDRVYQELLHICNRDFEIIVVNDGSIDKTLEAINHFAKSRNEIEVINLTRNFGQMYALSAGLAKSVGEYVVTMDADLQDPPEMIKDFYYLIEQHKEVDVIQGVRNDRSTDSFSKRFTAHLFYKFMRRISGVNLIPHAAEFRLMRKKVVSELNSFGKTHTMYRMLIPLLGYPTKCLEYSRPARFAGKTKYSYRKMLALTLRTLLEFSDRPLRLVVAFSFTAAIVLGIVGGSAVVAYPFVPTTPGWTSIIVFVSTIHALLLSFIGLMAIYISQIFKLLLKSSHQK